MAAEKCNTLDTSMKNLHEKLQMLEFQLLKIQSEVESCVKITKIDIMNEIKNLADQMSGFNKKMSQMDVRLDLLERKERECDMIISGVPEATQSNSNLREIFAKICGTIGFQPGCAAVTSIFRTKPKMSSKKDRLAMLIIVRFNDKSQKSNFVNKYFEHGNLSLKDIGMNLTSRIFCNDGLTPKNSFIFRQARTLQLQKKISKCYTRKGIVFIEPTLNAVPIQINDLSAIKTFTTTKSQSDTADNLQLQSSATATTNDAKSNNSIAISSHNVEYITVLTANTLPVMSESETAKKSKNKSSSSPATPSEHVKTTVHQPSPSLLASASTGLSSACVKLQQQASVVIPQQQPIEKKNTRSNSKI